MSDPNRKQNLASHSQEGCPSLPLFIVIAAHNLMDHLPCVGHRLAPSGPGSPYGFGGGRWVERESAPGCWLTERKVSQLDCPLSEETLQ